MNLPVDSCLLLTTQVKPSSDLDLILSEIGKDGLTLPQSNDSQLWARFHLAALDQ
jgi:hypothetical protein